jgi:hypothetical protein
VTVGDGPDHGARDVAIRHLTYTPIRRRDGVPDAVFDAYWRDVHGPLCARLPGLGYYVQHHLDRDAGANLWPLPDGVAAIDTVLDGMVEIGFADADGQARFEAASPLLFADERNFIGHDVAYALPEGARTLVDRDPDGVPNRAEPGHRIHVHLHGSGAAFEAAVVALAEAVALSDGIVKVRLHLPEPYRNSAPAPAAPEVDHVLPAVRKRVAMLEIAWRDRLQAESYFAGDAHAARSAALAGHVGAIGAWRVKGSYTFIRDGVLTTAGLRGSRAAALIDRLGARNQVSPDVARLFDGRPG